MTAPGTPSISEIHSKPEKNILLWSDVANATIYNLYWKKNKCPNCYFNNLDDWTLTESAHGAITSSDGKIKFDLDSGYDEAPSAVYGYTLQDEDYEVVIDILNYLPDSNNTGIFIYFFLLGGGDFASLRYNIETNGTVHNVRSRLRLNSSNNDTYTTPAAIPTKFRIARSGTVITTSIYVSGSWIEHASLDYSSRISNLIITRLQLADNVSTGGSVEYDNLIITPSVENSGTKIPNVTSPHDHISIDAGARYVYELTAENDDGESGASLESFETPAIDKPQKMSLLNGEGAYSFNTYSIDFYYELYQEIDFNNDSYTRSANSNLKTYNIGGKKRHILTFKNMSANDKNTLLTLWNLREPLYFYSIANGTGLRVRWMRDFNLHTPTNKSHSLIDEIYEGSIQLEEI